MSSQERIVHLGHYDKLKPTVNVANQPNPMPGAEWGPRIIPDCQFIYVLSGQASVWLGPMLYVISPGDCVFFGANSPNWILSSSDDPVTFCSIHFSFNKSSPLPVPPMDMIHDCAEQEMVREAIRYVVEVAGYGEIVIPHHFAIAKSEPIFLQIIAEYRNEEVGYEMVLRGLLTQLIGTIIRKQIQGDRHSAERSKVNPALEAIRKEPHLPWKTTELAALCGYHPTYFAEVFKQTVGQSPKHYLVLERIRMAKQMLLEAITIEQVAEQLGYTSPHYFARNFKAFTGLTPSAFRERSTQL